MVHGIRGQEAMRVCFDGDNQATRRGRAKKEVRKEGRNLGTWEVREGRKGGVGRGRERGRRAEYRGEETKGERKEEVR